MVLKCNSDELLRKAKAECGMVRAMAQRKRAECGKCDAMTSRAKKRNSEAVSFPAKFLIDSSRRCAGGIASVAHVDDALVLRMLKCSL